jgi:hypothetical protein
VVTPLFISVQFRSEQNIFFANMENENSEELDAAAAAREARRRRILVNSNKRLSKITGREHNEGEQ